MEARVQILYLSKFKPSARILRDALNNAGVTTTLAGECEDLNGPFIRYGHKGSIGIRNNAVDLNFNTRKFIEASGNKMIMSKTFTEAGVVTPQFYQMTKDPEDYPVMVRTTLSGFKGRGIYICETTKEFESFCDQKGSFWTPFLNISREYRVHVVNNQIVKLFKKVYSGEEPEDYPIRNMDNGYHFSIRNNMNPFVKLVQFVDRICEVMPIGFTAMDIGFLENERKYILIETNSAPGLNENSAGLFVDEIKRRLDDL